MTDKYTIENYGTHSSIRDRDNKDFACLFIDKRNISPNDVAELMNKAYEEGGKLCSNSESSFELEELKLRNKNLIKEYEFIKKRNNDLEKSLDYAYRASDILEKMGHRYCRKMYGLAKKEPDKITIEKEESIFGISFEIKKGDEVHGMMKDVDEKTVKSYIQPLVNYFYEEGRKDEKHNDR